MPIQRCDIVVGTGEAGRRGKGSQRASEARHDRQRADAIEFTCALCEVSAGAVGGNGRECRRCLEWGEALATRRNNVRSQECPAAFARFLREKERYTDLRWIGAAGWAGIRELLFTHAIIIGRVGEMNCYDDRWCYSGLEKARAALAAWDGHGEPQGWHRHPNTGRRRVDGSAKTETIEW